VSAAGRRIRYADELLAIGALDLPARELDFALQRLVAVGTVKLEFMRFHTCYLLKRGPSKESMGECSAIPKTSTIGQKPANSESQIMGQKELEQSAAPA
jgi:hypothetical protein